MIDTLALGMAADGCLLLIAYVVWKMIRYYRKHDVSSAVPWLKSRDLCDRVNDERLFDTSDPGCLEFFVG